jgi:hypothetical protein
MDFKEKYLRNFLYRKVVAAGFKPIGMTIMMCEETFIFKSDVEAKEAWERFAPSGWWYGFSDFIEAEKAYLKDFSDMGIHDHALNILWFDENYAPKPEIEP